MGLRIAESIDNQPIPQSAIPNPKSVVYRSGVKPSVRSAFKIEGVCNPTIFVKGEASNGMTFPIQQLRLNAARTNSVYGASYKVSKKRLPFRIDSVQVVIQVTHQNEVKDKYVLHPNGDYMLDTISDNKPMVSKKHDQYVFYSRKYCSFITASPLGTDVFIFKKTRPTMFGKKNWYYVNGQGFSVLRHKNRLSYNGKGNPADLSNITLLDWNKVRAEYGNGIIKIHTYDPKTDKFEVETIKNEEKK